MPCGPPISWKRSQDKVFVFDESADTNICSPVGNLRPSCGAGNCKRYAAEVNRSGSRMRDGNLQLVSALAQLRYRVRRALRKTHQAYHFWKFRKFPTVSIIPTTIFPNVAVDILTSYGATNSRQRVRPTMRPASVSTSNRLLSEKRQALITDLDSSFAVFPE